LASGPVSPGPAGPRRILLVDDEATVRFSLGRFLRLRGYEVDATSQEADALALLMAYRYDVVITDLRLSGSDGIEGLRIIERVRTLAPSARVILLTAYGTPQLLDEARASGVTTILSKPVALQDLEAAISASPGV
jgi:DNA-binding NtrC family response regulator